MTNKGAIINSRASSQRRIRINHPTIIPIDIEDIIPIRRLARWRRSKRRPMVSHADWSAWRLRGSAASYLCGEPKMGCESAGELLAFPCDEAACRGANGGDIGGSYTVFGSGDVVVEAHLGGYCSSVAEQDDSGGVVEGHGWFG